MVTDLRDLGMASLKMAVGKAKNQQNLLSRLQKA